MLKLFGSKQAQPELHAPELEKRYTRFAHTHQRTSVHYAEKTTRRPCEVAPVLPRRPSARKPKEEVTPASLADQLHSEADISTALLRRALPLRFADIDEETQDAAKEGVADLQARFR